MVHIYIYIFICSERVFAAELEYSLNIDADSYFGPRLQLCKRLSPLKVFFELVSSSQYLCTDEEYKREGKSGTAITIAF